MNARSNYITIGRYEEVDRRGKVRVVTVKAGFNKGKTYPYHSIKRGAHTDGWRSITAS